jgi:polysaccharide export outer membrane protein
VTKPLVATRRIMNFACASLIFSGMSLVLSGAANAQFIGPTPGPAGSDSPHLIPATPEHLETMTLLPGDLVEVQIFGIAQFDYKGRVADDGDISLPLVGKIHLGGETVSAAEQHIATSLTSAELVKDPQVNLHVLESPNHFATVTGEVKSPGPVPVYGEKHLLDVLSAAGGLTPASSPVVTIYRRGSTDPFKVQIPADASVSGRFNIVIAPGDDIVVSKVGVVYVIGAFHQQGAIPLKSSTPLTLIEAMSLAGGVNYEAALNKAYILRVSSDGRAKIPFKVSSVLGHHAPDMMLQNDDIVLIPTSDLKAALKGGAAGVAASLVAGIGYLTVAR